MSEEQAAEERPPMDPKKQRLRNIVRFTYDLQKMRIQSGNRTSTEVKTTELDEQDKAFLASTSDGLSAVEKDGFKEVKRLLKEHDIWNSWLKDQKGIGPAMGGLLIAFLDVNRADTPSKFWAYAGLAVRDGKADRLKKGERAHFDPWFKSKMIEVLAGSFLKAKSPWAQHYYDRKNRQENKLCDPCMLCKGSGSVDVKDEEDKKAKKNVVCYNCAGKGKGPWGNGPKHRDLDAKRIMVKHFLREFWVQWRTLEGLEVRPPYEEEYLGRKHHA